MISSASSAPPSEISVGGEDLADHVDLPAADERRSGAKVVRSRSGTGWSPPLARCGAQKWPSGAVAVASVSGTITATIGNCAPRIQRPQEENLVLPPGHGGEAKKLAVDTLYNTCQRHDHGFIALAG